jgi:hypothetical protein
MAVVHSFGGEGRIKLDEPRIAHIAADSFDPAAEDVPAFLHSCEIALVPAAENLLKKKLAGGEIIDDMRTIEADGPTDASKRRACIAVAAERIEGGAQ